MPNRRKWGGYIATDLIRQASDGVQGALHELEVYLEHEGRCDEGFKRICRATLLLSKSTVALNSLRDIRNQDRKEQGK